MVKYLKQNKVVIVLTGRYAGKKAVIVRCYDEGTTGRPYGHALICGLAEEPKRLRKKDSLKKKEKKCRLKTFIKVVNYNQLMPTRYTLDMDLKTEVTPESLENSTAKKEARKGADAKFLEKYKTGKNKWFFTKLYF
ncbi:hypothetical protein BSKO_08822 [Bryopsis sp. KO-2023]|nr:hypothetical protein BSKO_08822 [Bryopsis sp. KO-2023]